MKEIFKGRVGLIQRVKPNYRVPFFDELALRSEKGFSLAAGQPLAIESIPDHRLLQHGDWFKTTNLHFLTPSHPLYLCYQKNIIGWLNQWDPDALIVEANFRYLSSYAAIDWMVSRKRPVIGWGLGAKPLGGIIGTARDNFLKKFDALVAYSSSGAAEYSAIGFSAEKIFVAKNAVVNAPLEGLETILSSSRAELPIKLLFVGRLQKRKNVDLLIRAVASLDQKIRPRLSIVGDGPEMENLRKLADSLPVQVRFTGHLEGDELEREFIQSNLFVLPGTGGLAVQQAMSFGLPVIVEEGDGTQNDLVSAENGWLLKRGGLDELIGILQQALSTPEKLSTMGLVSLQIVKEEVNIQKIADVFVRALRSSELQS